MDKIAKEFQNNHKKGTVSNVTSYSFKYSETNKNGSVNEVVYMKSVSYTHLDVYKRQPFCGGASVLRRLLDSDIKVNHYICSDLNSGLIDLWNEIINNPTEVFSYYKKLWNELNVDDDKQRKKEYFANVRDRYNKEHNPLDFMFIMRTTTNGMPRYNRNGCLLYTSY